MDRSDQDIEGQNAPGFFSRLWRRLQDPTILAVPIVVVVFSLLRWKHLIANVPLWAIAVTICGSYFLTVLEAAMWPGDLAVGWRLQFRVGTVLAAIAVVIYSVGWGPTLALGLLFGVVDCMRTLGARAARPAMAFSIVFIGIGQVGIAFGFVPSLVAQPLVHALAGLAALGIVFTIKVLEWVFAERERTERRFKALVQRAADVIVVTDSVGRLTYVSPSFEDQLGYAPSHATSLLGESLAHPDDLQQMAERFGDFVLSTGETLAFELRIRAADGSWHWFEVTVCDLLDDPDVAGFVSNLHEITDRKASEAALADAEERFRTSFDEAPIGMILVSREGRILRANRAFGEIVGYHQEELAGLTVRELTHPDDREVSSSWTKRLLAGEVSNYQIEKRYLHADGRAVWTSLHASFVRDPDGNPLYAIGQIEDITERRAMSER